MPLGQQLLYFWKKLNWRTPFLTVDPRYIYPNLSTLIISSEEMHEWDLQWRTYASCISTEHHIRREEIETNVTVTIVSTWAVIWGVAFRGSFKLQWCHLLGSNGTPPTHIWLSQWIWNKERVYELTLQLGRNKTNPVVKDAVECIGRIPTPYFGVKNFLELQWRLRRMGCWFYSIWRHPWRRHPNPIWVAHI